MHFICMECFFCNNENRKYELHAVQVHLKYDIDISLWCSVMKGILVQKFYESR